MFSSVVRGGSGVCAHDWKLHADPYRFILQLMLPRMAISHPASYKDFSYSTCFWEISSRIQGRHAIVNLPPNINIELNKSSFANIHRDTNWIYIYIYNIYIILYIYLHTHTLAQNCNCEFCCGVHLTCENNPVTPDRKGSLKFPEKLWEALIAIASVVAIANEARNDPKLQLLPPGPAPELPQRSPQGWSAALPSSAPSLAVWILHSALGELSGGDPNPKTRLNTVRN